MNDPAVYAEPYVSARKEQEEHVAVKIGGDTKQIELAAAHKLRAQLDEALSPPCHKTVAPPSFGMYDLPEKILGLREGVTRGFLEDLSLLEQAVDDEFTLIARAVANGSAFHRDAMNAAQALHTINQIRVRFLQKFTSK